MSSVFMYVSETPRSQASRPRTATRPRRSEEEHLQLASVSLAPEAAPDSRGGLSWFYPPRGLIRVQRTARLSPCSGLVVATTTTTDGTEALDGHLFPKLTESSTRRPGDNADCEAQCSSTCQRTAYVANSDYGYTCNTTLSSTK